MPALDQLFKQPTTPRSTGAQCYEADVKRVDSRGVYVTIPGWSKQLLWGPCMPPSAVATVGDRVTVAISNQGRPWLLGAGGGEDPNIDGGTPGSIYGGDLPVIDGNGV